MEPQEPRQPAFRHEAERYGAWWRWAADAVGGAPNDIEEVARTALSALDAGATPPAAAALGWLACRPLTEDVAATLGQELARARAAAAGSDRERWLRLEALVRDRWWQAWLHSAGPREGDPPPASSGSPRPFLTERSIRTLSIMGAAVLLAAASLFQLIGGVAMLHGSLRFGGVLIPAVAFAAAGAALLRQPRFRAVGWAYLTLGALLAPLVLAAAYVLLGLDAQGVSADFAVLVSASACAAFYAALGTRLRAPGYAVLALLAGAAAWFAALHVAAVPASWWAPGLTMLTAPYCAVSRLGPPPFAAIAEPFLHAAALLQLGAVAVVAVSPSGLGWTAALAMALTGAVYAGGSWLSPNWYDPPLALLAFGLAIAFEVAVLPISSWTGLALVGAVWGCVALTFLPLPPRVRREYRQGALWASLALAASAVIFTLCTLPFQPRIAGGLAAATVGGLIAAYVAIVIHSRRRALAGIGDLGHVLVESLTGWGRLLWPSASGGDADVGNPGSGAQSDDGFGPPPQ